MNVLPKPARVREGVGGGLIVAEAAVEDSVLLEDDVAADGRRRFGRVVGALGGYLLVSIWYWRSLIPHLATHSLNRGLFDPGLFTWWLKWTPYAIAHGLNPFRSSYVNAPGGVSAMWNTSVLGLGVLFAPVTAVFGAVVSFNLACILGPPLSAWTAWLWLRRHVGDVPAAFGGLLFGFSPFVIDESTAGHLMLMWLCLLPVMLMLIEDLLWRSPRPMWPRALLLGVVAAAQLLIGSEVLLVFALGCVAMAFLVGVLYPRRTLARLRVLVPAAALAIGVAGVLCAYPLFEQFGGNRAIRPPIFPIGANAGRLRMLVGAPLPLAFHTGVGPHGHLSFVEDGLYIGWPLLVLLAAAAIVLFRRKGVRIAAVAIVGSVAFQRYGSRWHFAGLSVPAPFRLLQDHVALTRNILPGRFAILMWLAIAWLLAVALDTAMTRIPKRWTIAAPAVVIACLVPLLPGPAAPTPHLAMTPRLFTTSLRNVIPNGATVLLAPMANAQDAAGDLWQVDADMRFRQIGGYMLHPDGPNRKPLFESSERMLEKLFSINTTTNRPYKGNATRAMLDTAREELRAANASMVIVGNRSHETGLVKRARQLLGRPADQITGDAAIWRLSPS